MLYLDNSATTKISPAALEAMVRASKEEWGNPSSLHDFGMKAEHIIKDAKKSILEALGTSEGEGKLFFTSGGTEANNLAVFGSAYAKNKARKKIITDNSQHASVSRCLEKLESEGIEVVRLGTTAGKIDPDELEQHVDRDTILLSVMLVNNETGAIYDVANLFKKAKKINPDIITHTDAVQGFKKIPFSPVSLGADLVSISGHKIHAAKGTGAIWVSNRIIKEKKLVPHIYGGGQEAGFRSGTENVPGIASFGYAAKEKFDAVNSAIIRDYIIENLHSFGARANIPQKQAPHIISITVPGIKSETMLHFLSLKGIYVSSGSACSSHGKSEGVLTSFGLNKKDADCTIRVSLSGEETKEDADIFLSALKDGSSTLIKL